MIQIVETSWVNKNNSTYSTLWEVCVWFMVCCVLLCLCFVNFSINKTSHNNTVDIFIGHIILYPQTQHFMTVLLCLLNRHFLWSWGQLLITVGYILFLFISTPRQTAENVEFFVTDFSAELYYQILLDNILMSNICFNWSDNELWIDVASVYSRFMFFWIRNDQCLGI